MWRRDDRGQATVELALVLPIVVLLLAGVVWVGQLMATQVRLEHAAREGARAAVIEPSAASSLAATAVARTDVDFATATSVGAEFVRVEVMAQVSGVPVIGIGQRTLTADVSMRREDLLISRP